MSLRDWLTSPREWGEWGTKANFWFNELVTEARLLRAELDALALSTAGVADGSGSIVFGTNIGNYGSGYQSLRAVRTRDDIVYVSGLIQNNTGAGVADGSVVAQLPLGWRPATVVMSFGPRTATGGRVDINTTGQLITREFVWPNADFLWIAAVFQAA